ncbi:MAG: helicase-related protein [Fibrobacterales bacterium]
MDTLSMQELPVDKHASEFLELLDTKPGVVVSAPPGTGKSTRIPLYCREWNSRSFREDGKAVVVLQPRRLAAISLANRVAEESGTAIGQTIGYAVRGSRKLSPQSEIQFLTYGYFYEGLKSPAALSQVGVLILDEFHERHVEMDLIWAWMHYLKQSGKAVPKLILMSATLDEESIAKYVVEWGRLSIVATMHPIVTTYQIITASDRVDTQVAKAVKTWVRNDPEGTCLCFLPGWGEIQQAKRKLEEDVLYGRFDIGIEVLHGSLTLQEQKHVCRTTDETRIILTTNIAETSLTIAEVTGVIDSGWEREATWNPDKGVNSLGLKHITLQSAEQRRGRAGRTRAGWCIRLWHEKWERDWDQFWQSQLLKQEWSRSLLGMLTLLSRHNEENPIEALTEMPWITAPNESILSTSLEVLKEAECIDSNGKPLLGGDWMLSLSVHPRFARVLFLSRGSDHYRLSAAMIALLEGGGRGADSTDLLNAGNELVESIEHRGNRSTGFSKEATDLFKSLLQMEKRGDGSFLSTDSKRNIENDFENIWCSALESHIAILTQSNRYQLASGFVGTITIDVHGEYPPAILALDIWEQFRGGKRSGAIRSWVPLSQDFWNEFTQEKSVTEYRCVWTAQGKKVSVLKEKRYRDCVIMTENASEGEYPLESIATFLVEQISAGVVDSPLNSDECQPYLNRYTLLVKTYPEYGFTNITSEDIELMLYEWVGESRTIKELSIPRFISLFLEYISPEAKGLMESMFPKSIQLPSGKRAKFTYFTDAPPELSARITDFAGMEGVYTLCDGRVEVLYNLLAPNYRTAQKTRDLTEFWVTSYPAIKKELRGRYPRHPWP